MANELKYDKVREIIKMCEKDSKHIVTSNAFQSVEFNRLVTNNRVLDKIDHIFSHQIGDINVMDQEHAGLCWICAGMTMCRRSIVDKLKLDKKFQLSLNYLMFWDKLEKCNYFMNFIIENRHLKFDSEQIRRHYKDPISDGGYWCTFADLVKKYGMVPDSVNKRRVSTMNTSGMNNLLRYKLREFATVLLSPNNGTKQPGMLNSADDIDDIKKIKDEFMSVIVRILVRVIGNPIYPDTKFDWTYKTINNRKKTIQQLTPLMFYRDYCNINFDDYVVIVNDPRPRHPYKKMYEMSSTTQLTMDRKTVTSHLMMNLETDDMMKLIMKQIDHKVPVWFTCDVGKYSNHKLNVLDTDLYNYGLPFDTSFTKMSKADRLDFRDSYPSHAMAIVGYDIDPKLADDACEESSLNDSKSEELLNDNESEDRNQSYVESTESYDHNELNYKQNTSRKRKLENAKIVETENVKVVQNKKRKNVKVKQQNKPKKSKKITYDEKLKQIQKFKVENSWGDIGNTEGFYLMTIPWFKQYTYEAVIRKDLLDDDLKEILKKKPIKLKETDPLGTVLQ